MKRIGGSASLTLAIESPDFEANKKFADALVPRLRHDLGAEIANLDYKVDAVRDFFRHHAAVYLDEQKLSAIETDLRSVVRDRTLAEAPVPYDLHLDDDARVGDTSGTATLDAIDARLKAAEGEFGVYPDGYFAGEHGHLLAIFIRPRSSGADAETARRFIARVGAVVAATNPTSFHPAMKVGFTGAYQISLDEEAAIVRDLVSTAALCGTLIAVAIGLYFRRIRSVVLLGVTLLCGCIWAFGLARIAVGYLNIQTAFLGSIIAGTGINYGVILMARYLEERSRGFAEEDALATALEGTWAATAVAAAATAVSFGTLFIAHISSFRHFAVIGGGGIIFCWLLSYTLLPALMLLVDRVLPPPRTTRRVLMWPRVLARLPIAYPRTCVLVWVLCAGASVHFIHGFLPDILETDGRNLRNRTSLDSGAAQLDARIGDGVRHDSLTPAFVVTDSQDESRLVCEVLEAARRRSPDDPPIQKCRSVFSLLPEHQDEKLVVAHRIVDRIDALPASALTADVGARIATLRSEIDLTRVTLDSLPEEMTRPFREVSGEVGRMVAVYPPEGKDLWVQRNLYQFTDTVRRIDLGNGRVVTSSGDPVIFADILRMISRDAPRTTALALVGTMLLVLVALRRVRATSYLVTTLIAGVVCMMGISCAMHVKINFFNFIALPTTFGIAVDYALNVYARFEKEPGERSTRAYETLRSMGGAVFLCSLTTSIGYSTLLIAANMALVSFGKLAMLGELCCVLASLTLLPALLTLDRRA
ncbi:MAG: MMPL family transporter [Polyangia bacterium]